MIVKTAITLGREIKKKSCYQKKKQKIRAITLQGAIETDQSCYRYIGKKDNVILIAA